MDSMGSILNNLSYFFFSKRSAQENSHLEKGFSGFAYGMSKLAMNVMTAIQQREVDKKGGEDILINAVRKKSTTRFSIFLWIEKYQI